MVKVLVTGGRFYTDEEKVFGVLNDLDAERGIAELAHGGASGADTLGGIWFIMHPRRRRDDKRPKVYFAEWEKHMKVRGRNPAGFIRNQAMFDDFQPDVVVAFPGDTGTADMVKIARKAGVEVIEVE